MPETIWTYLTALLYFTEFCTCSAIAESLKTASHDSLTRMLKGNRSGHEFLETALKTLFTIMGGYLIIDDTVTEKPYSTELEEAAWVWSGKQKKTVFGVHLVLPVWTNGIVRVVVSYRVWKKGGPSKVELALEMIGYARNQLKIKPEFVLFDSWYASRKILKRIRDCGWYFVCRMKKNRVFGKVRLNEYCPQPYWQAVGKLATGVKVLAVRYRSRYYVTNRLTLSSKEVREIYRIRNHIEEVSKNLKTYPGIESCQAGYSRSSEKSSAVKTQVKEGAQEHHIALCPVAYLILEKERIERGISFRKLKQQLILQRRRLSLPSLKQIRKAA